ncbi:MAG: hypothetical protein NC409_08315 [Clostridium sp.]|nr:hypothetical protein [Clostridium sp.]
MEILTGNLYFVSDSFFTKIQDPYLKVNYENTKRPHYFAFKDSKTGLYWLLLFQDMFPITAEYIDGQYMKGGQPVRIANPKLIQELEKTAKKVINLLHRGVRFTPTQPDIIKIEKIMLAELQSTAAILDKGIDDMEAGRELPLDKAFSKINELRSVRKN